MQGTAGKKWGGKWQCSVAVLCTPMLTASTAVCKRSCVPCIHVTFACLPQCPYDFIMRGYLRKPGLPLEPVGLELIPNYFLRVFPLRTDAVCLCHVLILRINREGQGSLHQCFRFRVPNPFAYAPTQSLASCRSCEFGLAQTRKRLYFVMVHQSVADASALVTWFSPRVRQ